MMSWIYLLAAGIAEIAWAVGLKYTDGFSRLWPSVGTILGMILSFVLLSQALKTIPVGSAYSIWTGIGAVGTAVIGMALLGESREFGKIICIILIVTGIVGLKYFSSRPELN